MSCCKLGVRVGGWVDGLGRGRRGGWNEVLQARGLGGYIHQNQTSLFHSSTHHPPNHPPTYLQVIKIKELGAWRGEGRRGGGGWVGGWEGDAAGEAERGREEGGEIGGEVFLLGVGGWVGGWVGGGEEGG